MDAWVFDPNIFQFTLPRGERPGAAGGSGCSGISIHAPAWGATCRNRMAQEHTKFQSTLPRGERLESRAITAEAEVFQSTLPRGERLGNGQHRSGISISIHAPAWGATPILRVRL